MTLTTAGKNERPADMKLPRGYTCVDCGHYGFCEKFFGCAPTNITCDWSLSRFVPKLVPKERP